MTAEEVHAFIARLPPTVTRVEIVGVLVIEQAAPHVVRAVPEIGDVEKAAKARAEQKPSDVESLGRIPPAFREE